MKRSKSPLSNPIKDAFLLGYHNGYRAAAKIEVLTLEQYIARGGADRWYSDAATHRMPGASEGKRRRIMQNWQRRAHENEKLKQKLTEEYYEKVAKGEIRPPTNLERLIQTANGHEDNKSVMAARRLLAKKYGIDWRKVVKN